MSRIEEGPAPLQRRLADKLDSDREGGPLQREET